MAARPTPGLRGRREGSRTFNPATPGARRPKRPLLEGQTPALCIEPDDPEVPVGLAHRVAVADLQARHASVTLDRHDLRSEEHTSELQSRRDLVCRLLL